MAINELEQQELIEAQGKQERFKIEDLSQANWALRKVAVLEKKKEEINKLAQEELERIKSWQEKETEVINNSREYFETLLFEYLREQRKHDPKFKISTPYGKVSTRKLPEKWEYADDEMLVENLKKAGLNELIRVKESPDKANMKKVVQVVDGQAVTPDGEILSGVAIIEQGEKIIVKVGDQ